MTDSRTSQLGTLALIILIFTIIASGANSQNIVHITSSPQDLTLKTGKDTVLDALGIFAKDRLSQPKIDGMVIARHLLTESTLKVQKSGSHLLTYHDGFTPDYRGFAPIFDVNGFQDLLSLGGSSKPKILLDADTSQLTELFLNREGGIFWKGGLIYAFDYGSLGLDSIKLSSPDGKSSTIVANTGSAVHVSLSTDKQNWTEVWSDVPGSEFGKVDFPFPAHLAGSNKLYVKFSTDHQLGFLRELHITTWLSGNSYDPLLRVKAPQSVKRYSANSNRWASIFWLAPTVMTDEEVITYGSSSSFTIDTALSEYSIYFPNGTGAIVGRSPSGGMTGLKKVLVGNRTILSPPEDPEPWAINVVHPRDTAGGQPGTVGGELNGSTLTWAAYLNQRDSTPDKTWRPLGSRRHGSIDISKATFVTAQVSDQEARLIFRVVYEGKPGRIELLISAEDQFINSTVYKGISWQITVDSIAYATQLNAIEAASPDAGDRFLWQTWGDHYEVEQSFQRKLLEMRAWNLGSLPYYFTSGHRGAVLSYLDSISTCQVQYTMDAGKINGGLTMEFTDTSLRRSTPKKYWLLSQDKFDTKWEMIDEWTGLHDFIVARTQAELGIAEGTVNTFPRPTLWKFIIAEMYPELYSREEGSPFLDNLRADPDFWNKTSTADTSYFQYLMHRVLDEAHADGFGLIHIATPFNSDYTIKDSQMVADTLRGEAALYDLNISHIYGGEDHLKELVDSAHARDIFLNLIMTEGLSTNSPHIADHPDWMCWTSEGTPPTAYLDIMVCDMQKGRGFYDYARSTLQDVHRRTQFDGITFDSYMAFPGLQNHRKEIPYSYTKGIMQFMADLTAMGMTDFHLEGCGPIGLSNGGYGEEFMELEGKASKVRKTLVDHEYLVYNYMVDIETHHLLDNIHETYYKIIASKGIMAIIDLNAMDSLRKTKPSQAALIVSANKDWGVAHPYMQKRKLIATGDTWHGVQWTHSDSTDTEVYYSFDSYTYPVRGSRKVRDVTEDSVYNVTSSFTTKPFHTYIINNDLLDITSTEVSVNQTETQLSIFPNPGKDRVSITFSPALLQEQSVSIRILDILGKPVMESIVPERHRVTVPTTNLPSGNYIVSLTGDKAVIASRKLIILK